MFYKDENKNLVLNIFWNSLYIAFFLLPLDINFPTPFFIVSIIFGCINIFKSRKFVPENKTLLLFPLYFIVITLSLIYTENLSDGIALVQRSLTLLLFPVIFLFVKEDALSVRKLFDFLLLGLVISFFINLSLAVNDSLFAANTASALETSASQISVWIDALVNGWDYFIGSGFSRLVSPSYVSLYILLVLSFYLKKKLNSRLKLLVVFILFLYLYLLASRAAYFILMIMSLLLIFNIAEKSKKYTMLIIFVLGTIVFLKNPRIFEFEDSGNTEDYNATISENARLLSWDASIEAIKEAPFFGYGIGDANDVLINKYKDLEYKENYVGQYNTHNQFLQTWIQAGILGTGILISIFIFLAIQMRRSRNEFSVFLILFISLLFESMLVRFNGIVFFSIIVPLLLKKRSILSSRIIRNRAVLKSNS